MIGLSSSSPSSSSRNGNSGGGRHQDVNRLLHIVIALGVALAGRPVYAGAAPAEGAYTRPQIVKDLYYGDVLFHFYQDDFLGALTRLSAGQLLGHLQEHQEEAELLKGGLYLSLGQHAEAGRIFRELLDGNVAPQVADRAWFYLAKVWYQRNYLEQAESALGAIRGPLPGSLEGDRLLLHAQVLMYLERYEEAIRLLETWKTDDTTLAYARFNLGVALIRAGRADTAAPMLDAVGQMPANNQETAALRDKANLALGFAWLQANRAADARTVLERVRLAGPQSNKALLGLGWADSAERQFRNALAPWLELQDRDLLDPAVQEVHLAVPYAYAQLTASRQAADSYRHAIQVFAEEDTRLEQSIATIQSGRLLTTLLESDTSEVQGWYWQLRSLPDAPESRYLYHLLASHRFQEGLKNYRDLAQMRRNLDEWSRSLSAFSDMITTRQEAHARRIPVMERVLGTVNVDALEQRRNDLESRIVAIERENDVVGLATAAEADRWQRIEHMQEMLSRVPTDDPATADMRAKVSMLRGVLYWELNGAYKARLWRERKQLRDLDVALKDARRHQVLVQRASEESPRKTEEFAVRVAGLTPRIAALQEHVRSLEERQASQLAALAVTELEAQRERLSAYATQAQFALAAIYDRTVGPVAAAPEGAP